MNTARHPYSSALVLTHREEYATVDRQALRSAGVRQVRVLTSGKAAARWLAAAAENRTAPEAPPLPQIIFCDERLADMSGVDFIRLIRRHKRLVWLPVVFLSPAATEDAVIEAAGAGCSTVIARPYTHKALHEKLHAIVTTTSVSATLRRRASNGSRLLQAKAFDDAIQSLAQTSIDAEQLAITAYRDGMRSLAARRWDNAIANFNRALRHNTLLGEAQLGLAAAWRGKGDAPKYREHLRAAGETFARAAHWQRARDIYARLLRENPEAGNPLFREASRLIREGDIEAAAHALVAGYELAPETASHLQVARACQFTSQPEATMNAVCHAVARAGAPDLASRLRRRVLGSFGLPDAEQDDADSGGFLKRFPLLHDICAVASFTVRAWRSVA